MRLFVALELPEAVRSALSGWGQLAAGAGPAVRPLPAGSLHVTLCFLAEVPAGRVGDIARACEVAGGATVGPLTPSRALWLPPRRPRVLAVELEDPGNRLAALQGELSRALVAIEAFEPDPRPFLAHVTVARLRGGARIRPVELAAPPAIEFAPERVVLYRSLLAGGPARYVALHDVQLSRR